jgi:hypothetical protein
MYDDFEKRFDYTLKGDFRKWFERLEDVDIWSWCKWQESAVEHRVQRTAFRLSAITLSVGIIIGWFVFGG